MRPWKKVLTTGCVLLMLLGRFIPPFPGVSETGMAVLSIFLGTILLFQFVDTGWSGFLCLLAAALAGLYTLPQLLQMALGNSIFWFIIFGTMTISAMEKTGLLKRMALLLIRGKLVKGRPWVFITVFLLSAYVVAALMNLTATVLLFLALLAQLLDKAGVEKKSALGGYMAMGVLLACCMSNGATALGHVIPLASMGLFEELQPLSVAGFSIAGFPAGLVGLGLYILAMRFLLRLDAAPLAGLTPEALDRELGPMSRQEKICMALLCFILVWLLGAGAVQKWLPDIYPYINGQLTFIFPFVVSIVVMCLVHVEGEPLMNAAEAFRTAPWAAAFMVAIALLLGTLVQLPEAGLTEALSAALMPLTSGLPPMLFVTLWVVLCAALTQVTTNTLSVVLVGTVAAALISGGAVDGVHGGALGLALSIAASNAFATIPASIPAAIAAGQGWMSGRRQFASGMLAAATGVVSALLAYALAASLF